MQHDYRVHPFDCPACREAGYTAEANYEHWQTPVPTPEEGKWKP